MSTRVSNSGVVGVKATEATPPPGWALMERRLIDLMEEAAPAMVRKYTERGGAFYYADDLDDLYERTYNWGLFYALGADEAVLDLALQQWNAVTRWFDDSVVNRAKHAEYRHGASLQPFKASIHNEYYGLGNPGDADWHHMGEGNMAFYDFGLADPTISENVRRARRFAAMFIGEDPEAPNYDAKHKVFRSPYQTSQGPWLHADVQTVNAMLLGANTLGAPPSYYGARMSLHPIVKDLELDWYENPQRRGEIVALFDKLILNGDSPSSLGATALVTNAYLYTGEEKYKDWVLEYTGAWMDRMRRNGGIMPDNVGPTGKVGEHRHGQWWGGWYGWGCYKGFSIGFHSLTIAAECALLLTGDFGYLDLLRSQIKFLLDSAMIREDGQLISPARYGPNGWGYKQWNPTTGTLEPFKMEELARLYHASMSKEDYELIDLVRQGERDRDWNHVPATGEKNSGQTELARFQYYDGKNPDWPMKILRAEYEMALTAFEKICRDDHDVESLIVENVHPANPVYTKGLTQVTLGSPQSVYNGGLLRATVRYFDHDRARPGLPPDVAALVDKLAPDVVGIQLVNVNRTGARNLIVQAGAFGEHQFTEVRHGENVVPVDAKHFAVHLPPSTAIRVEAGLRRFVNGSSYAFPWHGDKVPVPFQ